MRHAGLKELVETLSARLRSMEERQDFAEKLMALGERRPEAGPSVVRGNDQGA